MRRFCRSLAVAVLSVSFAVLGPALPHAQGNNPQIIPPQAKFHGLSYGEWETKWWQAAFAIPIVGGDHPLFSGGIFGEEKGIRFLSGVGGGPTINITIPPGTALFFPIINAECSSLEGGTPFYGGTEAEQRACANNIIDNVSGLSAEVDGRSVQNLGRYRTQSPQYTFTLPADNILAVPGGSVGTSVDAGFYLLLAPLSVGRHTIHFTGTFDLFSFTIDTTYQITVSPK